MEENKEKNVGEYTYKTEQIAVCVGEKEEREREGECYFLRSHAAHGKRASMWNAAFSLHCSNTIKTD